MVVDYETENDLKGGNRNPEVLCVTAISSRTESIHGTLCRYAINVLCMTQDNTSSVIFINFST